MALAARTDEPLAEAQALATGIATAGLSRLVELGGSVLSAQLCVVAMRVSGGALALTAVAGADAADAAFLVAPDGPARRTLAADDPVGNEAIGRFPDAYRCAPAALDRAAPIPLTRTAARRFYAGAVLMSGGHRVGVICACGDEARGAFTAREAEQLSGFGEMAVVQLQACSNSAGNRGAAVEAEVLASCVDMLSVHAKSAHAEYTYVSPSCVALTGYAPQELLGMSSCVHVHPEDMPLWTSWMAEAADEGTAVCDFRLQRKDGEVAWVEAAAAAAACGTVCVTRDITERKAAEADAKRMMREYASANEAQVGSAAPPPIEPARRPRVPPSARPLPAPPAPPPPSAPFPPPLSSPPPPAPASPPPPPSPPTRRRGSSTPSATSSSSSPPTGSPSTSRLASSAPWVTPPAPPPATRRGSSRRPTPKRCGRSSSALRPPPPPTPTAAGSTAAPTAAAPPAATTTRRPRSAWARRRRHWVLATRAAASGSPRPTRPS